MVENNANFCFPHNLSYEGGTFHVRYYYPRLICCRHGRGGPTVNSPGGTMEEGRCSPAASPGPSPQRKPLLAHVEGSAVVSKIARPPPHHSPFGEHLPPSQASADRALPGGGTASRGAVNRAGGSVAAGEASEVILQQPSPTFASESLFVGRHRDDSTGEPVVYGEGTIRVCSCGLEEGQANFRPMGNGQEDTRAGPSRDTDIGLTSPPSPPTDEHRAVFKLSDGSDYSEDYTQMTDGSLSSMGASEEVLEGSDAQLNSSSVCSDVFSDRSSDTLEGSSFEAASEGAFLSALPAAFENTSSSSSSTTTTTQAEHNEVGNEEEDEPLPEVFARLRLDIEAATIAKTDRQDEDGDLALPPPEAISTPEITLTEAFDLQEDNLEVSGRPLEGYDAGYDDDDDAKGGFYEDREFEFLKAQPVKRSTSLKTYKTPPGTPKRKMVRFADALGLDLESVRHILNLEAPPKIPKSATKDLNLDANEDDSFKPPPSGVGARYLTACFSQPGSNPTFPIMVRDRKVMLENCVINDHNLSVTGTVRVANIAYHKEVTLRYTTNNWLTFNDISAGYVHGSNDGPTDRFSFSISLPHYFSTGSRLEFCLSYAAGDQVFWDNNHGRNYIVECFARALPDSDNTWMSFL